MNYLDPPLFISKRGHEGVSILELIFRLLTRLLSIINKHGIEVYLMAKKQSKTKKKGKRKNTTKYVKKTHITSSSPNHEIRSYFIDTTIELIEYLRDREHNKYISDKEKEKIRVNRVKAIINACNVGNRVLKDRQLDEYEKEMQDLKHGLMLDSSGDFIEVSPESVQEIEDLEFKFERLRDEGVSDNGN